ncbi:von Willebrand factor D and EGF domain-containing protein-like isoform X2 [Mytilus californianus]|uniref:von Willebrand factor D and EGF domain-containing protein-like isoform X2 n=1 Tax=Mytilus californianus TaxID=6549 RepID=UPI002246B9C5|nr:von Willebrand factor D and EGF domain-containing protein-like isoform X2 [Mytilus californianus]
MAGYNLLAVFLMVCYCFQFRSTNAGFFRNVTSNIHRYKRSQQAFCATRLEPQCCLGTNCCSPDFEGCCCDEACVWLGDCCPDYISTCQAGPCNQYTLIENEEKRSAGYITHISKDIPISDELLNETWYRVISDNGEIMPTYPPGTLHCGTINPIWLNGSLPNEGEENVTLVACKQTQNDVCEEEIDIKIMNCSGGFYVYYLPNTTTNSAYCFGDGPVLCDDGLSSESGYYPGCTSSFPNETILPEVESILIDGPKFNIPNYTPTPSLIPVFRCKFEDISNGTYVYDVNWYINGHNLTMYKNMEFDNINSTYLMSSDWREKYQMNMEVTCSVRVRNTVGAVPSPFYKSKVFHAGFYPEKYAYTVIEGEHIDIPFTSTVQVACIASHPNIQENCNQNFYIFQPKYQHNTAACMNNIARRDLVFEAQFCGIKLGNLDWNQTKYLKVYGFSDGLYNSEDRSTYIRVSTKSVSVFNEFWKDIKIPDIKVTVVDKDSTLTSRLCQSYNDPHITTFDGKYYDYMDVGEYAMYRNSRGPYWVHALFTNCASGLPGASCHCGVAVRSRNSLFVLRTCARISRDNVYLLQQPHTEIQTCDENDLSIEHNGNNYKITLPIGTEIQFTVSYSKFITRISIKPSIYDINESRGLCGVLSVTKDNSDDLTHRQLGPVTNIKSFGDSWRIDPIVMKDEQLFVNEPSFQTQSIVIIDTPEKTSQTNGTAQYCVCDQEAKPTDDLDQFYTVQCNLSESTQYCSSDDQSTSNKDNSIKPFVTSCYTISRKKRSLTHSIHRRSVSDSDDVIDVPSLEYDKDALNTSLNTTEPEFQNGWTQEEANRTCTENIQNALPAELLANVAGLTNEDYIKSCIEDIKLTADTTFVQDTVGAMQTYTLMEVSRNETLALTEINNGSQSILEYVTSLLCANNCSENGNCTSSVCSCYEGYIGDDCSISTSVAPSNISLPLNGLCGTRTRACAKTNIIGTFPSPDVWCKRRHFQILNDSMVYTSNADVVKAEYRNAFMVSVDLQSSRRKRSLPEVLDAEGYELSLSNDGIHFGESVNIIIYDEECSSCNATSVICVVLESCPDMTTQITDATTERSSTKQETTTEQITTADKTSTVSEPTTMEEKTTTIPITTTEEKTTTVPITTTEEKTTTIPITTTEEKTTTIPITTTEEKTTTVPITTTEEKTTTIPITTTEKKTTTHEKTTTEENTKTVVLTTTAEKASIVPITTTEETTTTVPIQTTTEETTTTVPIQTTTEKTTTTVPIQTTTEETTTIPEVPTTEDKQKNDRIIYYEGIMGSAIAAFLILVGIVLLCCKIKLSKSRSSDKTDGIIPVRKFENWTIYSGQPRKSVKEIPKNLLNFGLATRFNSRGNQQTGP